MRAKQVFDFSDLNQELEISQNNRTLLLDQNSAKDLAVGLSQCLLQVNGPKISVVVENQTLKCRAKQAQDNEVVVHVNLGKFHLFSTTNAKGLITFLKDFTSESFQREDF